jgi:hypothetical protein
VLDAYYCSSLGLPSTVIVTEPFESLARLTVKNLGLPNFVPSIAPHPIWTRNDDWFDPAAQALAPSIQRLLKQPGIDAAP